MARTSALLVSAGILLGTLAHAASVSAAPDSTGLATYRNQRHGFSLAYPAGQFVALPAASEDARLFVSNDDKARLLVGALDNTDGKSLGAYREFLLRESYAGGTIDYAPVRSTWFVLSGVRKGTAFYQRVTFACGGRKIISWALLYPEAEKAVYDRVVEQVHASYRAGDGNCG